MIKISPASQIIFTPPLASLRCSAILFAIKRSNYLILSSLSFSSLMTDCFYEAS